MPRTGRDPKAAAQAGDRAGGPVGEWRNATLAVDSFRPNPWGLHNVHGNVWDWTEDCWNETNAGNPGDGSARSSGDCKLRVVRGGYGLVRRIKKR